MLIYFVPLKIGTRCNLLNKTYTTGGRKKKLFPTLCVYEWRKHFLRSLQIMKYFRARFCTNKLQPENHHSRCRELSLTIQMNFKKKIEKWLYSIFAKFHLTCDWFYRWVAFFRWNFNTIKCAYSAPKRAIVTKFFVKYKNLKNHLKLSISLSLLLSVCIEILIP